MLTLDCDEKNLTDDDAEQILQNFFSNSSASNRLVRLELSMNHLTRVPKSIRLFPQLSRLNLANNQITTVKSGDFNFTTTMDSLRIRLSSNRISYIEPNAFLGKVTNLN